MCDHACGRCAGQTDMELDLSEQEGQELERLLANAKDPQQLLMQTLLAKAMGGGGGPRGGGGGGRWAAGRPAAGVRSCGRAGVRADRAICE